MPAANPCHSKRNRDYPVRPLPVVLGECQGQPTNRDGRAILPASRLYGPDKDFAIPHTVLFQRATSLRRRAVSTGSEPFVGVLADNVRSRNDARHLVGLVRLARRRLQIIEHWNLSSLVLQTHSLSRQNGKKCRRISIANHKIC